MAGAFSNYMEGKIIDSFLRNTAYTPAATVYLALYESSPGETNAGTETSYTGYARQAVAWTAEDVATGQTKNTAQITFPANGNASASVTITSLAIYDALTTGNMLMYADLSSSKTLAVGDVLAFAANAIVFTID